MAKTMYNFTISISPCGDSSVDYPVTAKEKKLIDKAVENGDCFEDAEELSDLYERVMEAAQEQLEEDLELDNENDLDPEDLDYCVDFSGEAN